MTTGVLYRPPPGIQAVTTNQVTYRARRRLQPARHLSGQTRNILIVVEHGHMQTGFVGRDPLKGFHSVDVISVSPDHPDRKALRDKFLSEHVHTEFEVRFFVDGRGLFFLHIDDWVYAVLCEKGDLISVPSGVRHWFDLGEHPDVKAIRLFSEQSGWVAHYTNDDIAQRFPLLERFLAEREMGPV